MSATEIQPAGAGGATKELEGKRALVTGAGRGLGRATAQLLAKRGATVVVTDIDEAGATAVAEELGNESSALRLDVTSEDDFVAGIEAAKERMGGLDILVNNAGIEIAAPVVETTVDQLDKMYAINIRGVFLGTKYGALTMAGQGGGAIVNIASVAGLEGSPLLGIYCASKAAVVNLTRVAAYEMRDHKVRINSVCPAFIDGEMVDRLRPAVEAVVPVSMDELAALKQGRLGTADEVAEIVAWLASDEADWVTGSEYVLDGGIRGSLL